MRISKKHFIILTTVLMTIFVGFFVGRKSALQLNENYRREIETKTLENNPVPQCDMGKCPEYKTFDADGDGKLESVVIEPIGMSQFAGRIMVIDEGKVIFVSDEEMFIGVKPINDKEDNNGFIIFYSKVPNVRSNKDIEWAYYKYADGKYTLEKITTPAENIEK